MHQPWIWELFLSNFSISGHVWESPVARQICRCWRRWSDCSRAARNTCSCDKGATSLQINDFHSPRKSVPMQIVSSDTSRSKCDNRVSHANSTYPVVDRFHFLSHVDGLDSSRNRPGKLVMAGSLGKPSSRAFISGPGRLDISSAIRFSSNSSPRHMKSQFSSATCPDHPPLPWCATACRDLLSNAPLAYPLLFPLTPEARFYANEGSDRLGTYRDLPYILRWHVSR
jgi:hypothetical protein